MYFKNFRFFFFRFRIYTRYWHIHNINCDGEYFNNIRRQTESEKGKKKKINNSPIAELRLPTLFFFFQFILYNSKTNVFFLQSLPFKFIVINEFDDDLIIETDRQEKIT